MNQITVRGIDEETEGQIRKLAGESGKSINRVILELIEKATGAEKEAKRKRARMIRDLAGGWSSKDASEFMRSIQPLEKVDEDMWK